MIYIIYYILCIIYDITYIINVRSSDDWSSCCAAPPSLNKRVLRNGRSSSGGGWGCHWHFVWSLANSPRACCYAPRYDFLRYWKHVWTWWRSVASNVISFRGLIRWMIKAFWKKRFVYLKKICLDSCFVFFLFCYCVCCCFFFVILV